MRRVHSDGPVRTASRCTRRWLATVASVAALLLGSKPAPSDTVEEPLTAERAVTLAVEHNPELQSLALREHEEVLKGSMATAIENPELRVANLRSDHLRGDADGRLADLDIGVRWSPPNPLVNGARRAASVHLVSALASQREEERRALVARVLTLHAKVLNADDQVRLARNAVDLRTHLARTTGLSEIEKSAADLDALEETAELLDLEERRREVLAELATVVGLAVGTPVVATGPERVCERPREEVAELVAMAMENDAARAARESKLRAIAADRSRLRRELVPWFSFVQVGSERADHNTPSYEYVRFGISVPLFNGGGKRIALLDEKRRVVLSENDRERLRLGHRVEQAVATIRDDAVLVAQYEEASPRLVDQTEALLQRSLAAGRSTLADVVKLQTRRIGAQRAVLKTKLRCQLSLIELDRLVGR
jgi:outer membrane protein TolC